jgi:large subunit ribosomal protein L9
MEIILLQDVDNLGKKGEVATVADGYARNFLLPRKMAERATAARVAVVRKVMQEKVDHERREVERADEIRDILARTVLTIPAKVGEGDRLFGSVTNQDIATAIFAARKIRVDKRNVSLEEPIKTVGTFMVKVEVNGSVEAADVKVMVVPEGSKE